MANQPDQGGSFPRDRYTNPETALGGADAVEKTTYVTGAGAEPERRRSGDVGGPGAKGGRGPNVTLLIIVSLVVLAVLVYLLRAFT